MRGSEYERVVKMREVINQIIIPIIVSSIAGVIVLIIQQEFFSKKTSITIINNNTYTMDQNNINTVNSPGSINTIGQTGNNTVNNINLGEKPRTLNGEFKKDLLNELNKLNSEKPRPVVLGVVDCADAETINLFNQIKNFLVDNGVSIQEGMTTFHPSNPVFGVKINITNPDQIALMVGPKEM